MKQRLRFIALIASLIAFLATDGEASRRRNMSNKEIVRDLYENCINTGKLDRLDQLVSEEYEAPEGGRGAAAFRANVDSLRVGFPDIRFTVEDLIAEGDRVVVRWSWEATHDGSFRGIPPTHKRITNTGIAIYQFRDGKIIRNWLETDRLGALQQLGALPR